MGPREASETTEKQLAASAHRACPNVKAPLSTQPHSCRTRVLSAVRIRRIGLQTLRMAVGGHVYVPYSSPRLDSEPLLYGKAMSPPSFRLPGAEVSAFPVMKPIQHPGLCGARGGTGARPRAHAGEPRHHRAGDRPPLSVPSRLGKSSK